MVKTLAEVDSLEVKSLKYLAKMVFKLRRTPRYTIALERVSKEMRFVNYKDFLTRVAANKDQFEWPLYEGFKAKYEQELAAKGQTPIDIESPDPIDETNSNPPPIVPPADAPKSRKK